MLTCVRTLFVFHSQITAFSHNWQNFHEDSKTAAIANASRARENSSHQELLYAWYCTILQSAAIIFYLFFHLVALLTLSRTLQFCSICVSLFHTFLMKVHLYVKMKIASLYLAWDEWICTCARGSVCVCRLRVDCRSEIKSHKKKTKIADERLQRNRILNLYRKRKTNPIKANAFLLASNLKTIVLWFSLDLIASNDNFRFLIISEPCEWNRNSLDEIT